MQNKSVGYYDDEEEAAREYDKAVLELRGPRAQTNLVQTQPSKPKEKLEVISLPSTTDDEVALAVQSIVAAYNSGECCNYLRKAHYSDGLYSTQISS